jgi:hypothetical protein
MSNDNKPSTRLLTLDALKRANSLALTLLVVLAITAFGLFMVLDALGWGTTGVRAMVALLVAPLILIVLAGGAWLFWRAGDHTTTTPHEVEEEAVNG